MLEATWVGRRVVLRRTVESADGARFADTIGDLVSLSNAEARVLTGHGAVTIAVSHIVAARVVAPSTADVLALEGIAARGWRAAETEQLAGWLMRANGGITARANSVLPLAQPDRPLDDALVAARRWYADRGLPLRIQLPLPARGLLDRALADRGWQPSPDVRVLAGRLDTLAARPARADVPVELLGYPDAGWMARYRGGTTPPGTSDLLARHDQVAFASIRHRGATVAIGRGAVDGGWLGITAVEVDGGARRRGVASAIVRALWGWARDTTAATRSYLQVQEDNEAALALCGGLGYWRHHDYRYRAESSHARDLP